VAKGAKLEKTPLVLEVEGKNQNVRFFGLANLDSFQTLYGEWKQICGGLRGEAIGSIKTDSSLLQQIKLQGVTGRYSPSEGSGAKHPNEGGVEILALLDSVETAAEIDDTHKAALEKAIEIMEAIKKDTKSEKNPRNIIFEHDPILTNRRGIRIGKGKPVYGHYRTPAYYKQTQKKNKHNGKTKIVTAVESTWYNKSAGAANPPMYQALYGDTFDIGLEKSLLDCVKEALRNIETTPLGVSKDTPIEISQSSAGRNSWEKAMKVSGIKTIVKKWLDKPSGNGYFRVNSCKGQVGRTRIKLYGAGKRALFEILGITLPNEVKSAYFKVSERQLNRMAEKIFNGRRANKDTKAKPIRNYNALQISNFKEPEEKKEVVTKKPEEATKKPEKDSTTEKKSWSEILRRESYVEVL
tara:strand:+ start:37 stop:1266 length:1230 start_codon:yes stop_codon:yes gene_type:complete